MCVCIGLCLYIGVCLHIGCVHIYVHTCRGSGKAQVARQVARHCSPCCTCSPVWHAIVRILCLTRVEPMYTASHVCKGHLCSCSSHKSLLSYGTAILSLAANQGRATAAPLSAVGCPTDKEGTPQCPPPCRPLSLRCTLPLPLLPPGLLVP